MRSNLVKEDLDDLMNCFVLFSENCKDPGIPERGGKIGSSFDHGKTLSFSCNVGYTLVGAQTIECREGIWSAQLPLCKGKFPLTSNLKDEVFFLH